MNHNIKFLGIASEEYESYYKLYGDLIFCVPFYYDSYVVKKDGGVQIKFPSGSSMETWRIEKTTKKDDQGFK